MNNYRWRHKRAKEHLKRDVKALKALKGVRLVIEFLNNEESFCSDVEWVDTKGYSMSGDIGYFFAGLTSFEDMILKRLRKAIPKYKKACETYKE